VGEGVYIGNGAFLDPDFCFLIRIDDHARISENVTMLAHDGSTRTLVGWTRLAPVVIGERSFVGAGSIILPGVTVGARAIVGAGSVVRKDVEPDTVVAGNPARVVTDHAAFLARHREAVEHRPSWPREGWAVSTGITPERRERMLQALLAASEGYIR
jgi:maltose O-acetyltransferase